MLNVNPVIQHGISVTGRLWRRGQRSTVWTCRERSASRRTIRASTRPGLPHTWTASGDYSSAGGTVNKLGVLVEKS